MAEGPKVSKSLTVTSFCGLQDPLLPTGVIILMPKITFRAIMRAAEVFPVAIHAPQNLNFPGAIGIWLKLPALATGGIIMRPQVDRLSTSCATQVPPVPCASKHFNRGKDPMPGSHPPYLPAASIHFMPKINMSRVCATQEPPFVDATLGFDDVDPVLRCSQGKTKGVDCAMSLLDHIVGPLLDGIQASMNHWPHYIAPHPRSNLTQKAKGTPLRRRHQCVPNLDNLWGQWSLTHPKDFLPHRVGK